MPKKGKTKFDEEVAQLANLLRNEHGEDGILVSQCEFWTALRARLSENDAAVVLEALGDLAMTILSSDDNAPEAESPHASSKRLAPRSSGKSKAPAAKKQRKAHKKAIISFNLPGSTPATIKIDLANLVQVATSRDRAPFRIAYPWVGQRCWYNPNEYRELHLQHYRSWMRHWSVFYACALYAPSKNCDERRKQKLLAIAARTNFLGSNVEEFGYYGFLELFKNVEGEVAHLLLSKKKVALYNENRFKRSEQGDDDSDFEDEEGEYTAMAPTPPIPLPKPSATSSDIEEPHSGFTEDAPVLEDTPPAPKSGPQSAGFSWPNHSGVVEL
ncbi:hypothetical protein PR003_g9602 [Phytophthora rubi]|uniref:Uncharacterized protein n=1 Tax=Phytophthora rubi TaxID=129364 RepID=A0A6A3MSA3_9STRA|nr:hypothetical protein PR001_g9075 [Phytophthora rubi]KAE9342197.1 hypothetical protein PR003_g9602 [Phytophthora rubi]